MCQAYEAERGLVDLLEQSYRRDCAQGKHDYRRNYFDRKMTVVMKYGIMYVPARCDHCHEETKLILVPQDQTTHKGVSL